MTAITSRCHASHVGDLRWPYDKPPTNVPKRRVSIKRKKYAGEWSGHSSLCLVSCVCGAAKLEDASFDHIPSASRPSSPDTQLAATSPGQGAELSREEAATYSRWGDGG